MIRLGGPVFTNNQDPAQLARAHRDFGYRAAYAPGVDIHESARIREIRQAFEREDVILAECNAWGNLLGAKGEANIARAAQQLALADELGALCTVDYLGSLAPGTEYGPHIDNLALAMFDTAVQIARGIIDTAKPRRAKFALEMMQWLLPDSAEVYLRLLQAIDRPAFAVHLDPVNIIVSPRQYYDTASVLDECFRLLGSHVISCHAKDLSLRNELALHFDEVLPGTGGMNYPVYIANLHRLPREVPLMLEHLKTEAEYRKALAFLTDTARRVGAI